MLKNFGQVFFLIVESSLLHSQRPDLFDQIKNTV